MRTHCDNYCQPSSLEDGGVLRPLRIRRALTQETMNLSVTRNGSSSSVSPCSQTRWVPLLGGMTAGEKGWALLESLTLAVATMMASSSQPAHLLSRSYYDFVPISLKSCCFPHMTSVTIRCVMNTLCTL